MLFIDAMVPFLGKTLTISMVGSYYYLVKENSRSWTDEMFVDKEKINNWQKELGI